MSILRLSAASGNYAAWDLSHASYSGTSFDVSSQETSPEAIFFKPDGTKMYVVGTAGDDVNEYDLSSAWDISTASYNQNFNVASQETFPTGLFFKPDGTRMYVVGPLSDSVSQYNLISEWDISSAVYDQNLTFTALESSPQGLFFKPDGTKMYIVGPDGEDVTEFNSSWSVSSSTYNAPTFDISPQDTAPSGLFFKPDGTKMYIVGDTGNSVYEYGLSTAWAVSSAFYVQSFSVASQDTAPTGLSFRPDGRIMYVLGDSTDTVYQYNIG